MRLFRQLAVENLLLALAGAASGLLLAYAILRGMVGWMPANIPRVNAVGMNSSVLAFTLALGFLTGLIFGVAPALAAVAISTTGIHPLPLPS